MATGFPVKANYATGDVLTAANMNDLSGTVNYLQYMPPRNAVLNSNFSVWQRGTSIASGTGSPYTADRWQANKTGVAGLTISRQATSDTTNLPNIQYCARVQRDSGVTSTAGQNLWSQFETINSIPFAGKAVTLSFYARAGANYSSASNALTASVITGTGTDQNYWSGYTGSATPITGTATLTTTWQRFTFTGTLAATATEITILFANTPVGTAGVNDYYEITGVQLELGSVANTYMPNQPTYQGELAACQRYYQRFGSASALYGFIGTGFAESTIYADLLVQPIVTLRGSATLDYSTLRITNMSGVSQAVTSLTLAGNFTTGTTIGIQAQVASGLTAGNSYLLTFNNSASGYLAISSEL